MNDSLMESLKADSAGIRLQRGKFGARRALNGDQVSAAADTFDASGEYMSASKKLIDTKHAAYRLVTAILGEAHRAWKLDTLPFPEDGVRLIRRSDLPEFAATMKKLQGKLADAVKVLEDSYSDLRIEAKQKLGSLYNEKDYPATIGDQFSIAYSVVNLAPPDYLAELSPELYKAEQERVAAQFQQAMAMAESAFAEELAKLVDHLTERLSGKDEDGKQKVFRDSAITNLTEFIERFQKLNIGSDKALDGLVEKVKSIVAEGGEKFDPKAIRSDVLYREQLADKFNALKGELGEHLKLKPKRKFNFGVDAEVQVEQAASPASEPAVSAT